MARVFFRRHWWAVLYSLFLTAFTVYLALDTFTISQVYTVVPDSDGGTERSAPSSGEQEDASGSDAEPVLTESSYSDGNMKITITEYREQDTSVYVADVVLASPDYLQTALAQNAYGRNVTVKTSEIAESAGLSLYQLAEFMAGLGAVTAYNLDGGGSSTMHFVGEVINNPTTDGRRIQERSVSDIVCIGY